MTDSPAQTKGTGSELFFELASSDRKRILSDLRKENLRLSQLAKRLNVTNTEAFRQLQRLTESSLIQRLSDGSYGITEYGSLVLQLTSPLDFVSEHQSYFLTHDLLCLPRRFLDRMGVLSKASLTKDTMEGVNSMRRLVAEAKEYAWGATIETFPDHGSVIGKITSEGATIRAMGREGLLPPRAYNRNPSVEWRASEEFPVNLVLNEREAGITFPLTGGKMDNVGFYGNDQGFHGWVKDIFLYYWDRGKRNLSPRTV
jgi:predicted transcriptional regulator